MTQHHTALIPTELAGARIDQALAKLFPYYSRTVLQGLIHAGKLLVDARTVKPKALVHGGERIDLWLEYAAPSTDQAQAIPLSVIYEDEDLLVIDKPAGLVVHPGAGNRDGTLLNALLHHAPVLAQLPRAGIVHRLDKDTSGILVVARSLRAHTSLVRQLQARTLGREYQAIVRGVMVAGGRIEAPVGRHPTQRTRMAVTPQGRTAITDYRVLQRFPAHTHVHVKLATGRTHQIRVHMAELRYPVLGDVVYGGRVAIPRTASPALAEVLRNFKRQALHAWRLRLEHPASGEVREWAAPLPQDMELLLQRLEQDTH
jgi:23S rRNA pseudouridine1911/1915/1917 synthase